MERGTKRSRESGAERMSCHISCNPLSLALKTLHSRRIHNPRCHSNRTDELASLTLQPIIPTQPPTLVPHGYLSWLGWVYLEAN